MEKWYVGDITCENCEKSFHIASIMTNTICYICGGPIDLRKLPIEERPEEEERNLPE